MPFYTFNQNNSGGGFDRDERVAEFVIIEAEDAESANSKAEEIGIYFDYGYTRDCRCCGTRWDETSEHYAKAEPLIYGEPADAYVHWDEAAKCIIYYANGEVDSFYLGGGTNGT